MKLWSRAVVAAVALANMAGCELVADLGPERHLTAGSAGAGSDCPPPFPAPPEREDEGEDTEFVAAVYQIDFGERGGVGRNIDGVCSRTTEEGSCQGKVDQTDGVGGIDNRGSQLLPFLDANINGGKDKYFNSEFQSQEIQQGKWTIIGRVRGWNGRANDKQIEFAWYISGGIDGPGSSVLPKWDGTDVWKVSPDSVADPASMTPAHVDAQAYVTDWTIVAGTDVERIEVPLSGGRIAFTIRSPTITGKIVKHPEGYAMSETLITGVWRLDEVFDMISSFRAADQSAICKGMPIFDAGKALFCQYADISVNGAVRSAKCDAISFGIATEGFPIAAIGGVHAPLPDPSMTACPEGTDPRDERCDP